MYSGYANIAVTLKTEQVNEQNFYEIRENLGEKVWQFWEQTSETVRMAVFRKYEELGIFPDEYGILNIEVSYDGTWLTRGHKSHISIGFVAEIYTGFVLDMEVLSDFCRQCSRLETQKRKGEINEEKYSNAKEKHQPACAKNFDGISGAMEKEAGLKIWARSVQKNNMRCVVFVGDGDAKTFTVLQEINDHTGPYDIPVR